MPRGDDTSNHPKRRVDRASMVMRDLQSIIEGNMTAPKSITSLGKSYTCPECSKTFNNPDEWQYGHDCESC